jgi:hypothetical protein
MIDVRRRALSLSPADAGLFFAAEKPNAHHRYFALS